jgi:serine/threonine-protein kinase
VDVGEEEDAAVSSRPDDGDATLPAMTDAETEVGLGDLGGESRPRRATTGESLPAPRGYTSSRLLGQGGMGEVLLAHDERVGRNVALKRLRSQHPSADALARFLREAKIQARLEHPAIVPVYEMGEDADGAPYFTMKRLAGVTLLERLEGGGSRQALLRAFVDVSLAVDYAHARGVVHRDLKPSNIMLGNFGEVYVLDWGVARVLGTPREASDSIHAGDVVSASDIATLDSQTQVGAVLGTPGYMPPEQLAGGEVTPAADVYALGSMLFEILAGESLHPRGTGALGSTLSVPTASPAARQPSLPIPPELDAACTHALAAAPEARPSARELANRVQRYLDGDRDGERRRALAEAELALARTAVDSGDPARRADAVAAAGRALALDPSSRPAAELVGLLMLAPPDEVPPELARELAEIDRGLAVTAAKTASVAILIIMSFALFIFPLPVVSWTVLVLFFGGVLGTSALAGWMAWTKRPRVVLFLFAWEAFLVIFSRGVGPWILAPAMVAVTSSAIIALPQLVDRPILTIGVALATLLAPVVLEALGVFSPTWSLHDGAIVERSAALRLEGPWAIALLVVAHVAMVVVNLVLARTVAVARRDAHRRAEMQAWHLRKLVPEQAQAT